MIFYIDFLFLTGVGVGLVYIYNILPSQAGKPPKICPTIYPVMHRGMVIVPVTKQVAVHLHHWILYLLILAIFYSNLNSSVRGFLLTLIVQGYFGYSDSLRVWKRNPWTLAGRGGKGEPKKNPA